MALDEHRGYLPDVTGVAERSFILLATHNGERFLREQVESLQAQTWSKWRLLAHDDYSTDGTPAILQSLAASDSRITLIPRAPHRLGASASFARLIERAIQLGAEYAFPCDQDDVWLPHKLERQMRALLAAENAASPSTPILVHSDLRVVDESLQELHPSYRKFNGVSYDRADPLATLALHNAVVGCTAGFNRALMKAALPFPCGTFHDWWLAQCAAACGQIVDCTAATVLYRQHGANLIGAHGRHAFIPRAVRHPRAFVTDAFDKFRISVSHAFALKRRMAERPHLFSKTAQTRVETYCSALYSGSGVIIRLRQLGRSGIRPQRFLSFWILYALVAAYPHLERVGDHPGPVLTEPRT